MENDLVIQQFLNFTEEHHLFKKEDKLILACSGGVDSVVLAHLLHKLNYDFSIAHCNFKLRGSESEHDEFFVRDLASKLKVPFYGASFDTEKSAKRIKKGIQETARILRYEWFYNLAKETGAQYVLTAHHFDDSVETFFINLLRGSGITGLAGISHSYRIFRRPLIFLRKDEIINYAQQHLYRYRTDSSNAKDDYLRNRLRHHLTPLLESVSDKGLDGVLKSIQYLSNERKIIHYAINQLNDLCRLKTDMQRVLFDLHVLEGMDLTDSSLFHILKPYNFNTDQVNQIINSYRKKNSGKYFYSPGFIAVLSRNILEIIEVTQPELNREYLINEPGEITYPVKLSITEKQKSPEYKSNQNHKVAFLNPESLVWPLKLRHWKEGDSFTPLGMNGEKKLSDFFIDEKLSVAEKNAIWILENGNKEIIWVPGYRISDHAKIDEKLDKMLVFCYGE